MTKCKGRYSTYPDNCEMCPRYMDDCDGADDEDKCDCESCRCLDAGIPEGLDDLLKETP